MIPLDMGLPSYVLYGPSTLASSMEASRDAKYMVSKMSGEEEMEGCVRGEWGGERSICGFLARDLEILLLTALIISSHIVSTNRISFRLTFIELHSGGTLEGESHAGKGIGKTLHPDSDWAVPEVAVLRLR
jgi:hypothetical protein